MRRSALLLSTALAGALAAGTVTATTSTPAEAAPGPDLQLTVDMQQLFNQSLSGERFSSPAVGDLDADGVPDVVAGFPDGTVYGWSGATNGLIFARWSGPGAVQASPGLVDFDGDGRLDVVAANLNGDTVIWNAAGAQLFFAHTGSAGKTGNFATPAIADIDGDGRLDVIESSFDHYLHAWGPGINPPELRGFPVGLQDTSWSSPAVGDIDNDGQPEIVVGYDCDGAPGQRCYPGYGGYVGAFNGDGSVVAGWPRFIPGQVVWSSPALGDLDGDGQLEVVVGTGNLAASMVSGRPMAGTQVFAFRGSGSDLPGWPVTLGRNVTSSPALGDLDGDGLNDVVVVGEDGYAHAYKGSTGGQLWARCAGNITGAAPAPNGCPPLHASAAIADVMGLGSQQVVLGGEQWVHVFDGATGTVLLNLETKSGTLPLTAAPSVSSLNGQAVIYAAGQFGSRTGIVYAWKTGKPLGAAAWPTFKGSSARTGALRQPIVVQGAIKAKWEALGGADGFLGRPTGNQFGRPGTGAQMFQGGMIGWTPAGGARVVRGAILGRYLALGGPLGSLGLPITDEYAVGAGSESDFQNGAILWSARTGARSVQNAQLTGYRQLGGPAGPLGFPVSDSYVVPSWGWGNDFEKGLLVWSPTGGSHMVRGAILGRYQALGGPRGALGLPITDEYAVGSGSESDFQNGAILWSARTGARSVQNAQLPRYRQLGGPTGALGFPLSDSYVIPNWGWGNDVEKGLLLWSPTTGTHPVVGPVLAQYNGVNSVQGPLGLPITDEYAVGTGLDQDFQGGRIYWSAATGPHTVTGPLLRAYADRGGPGSSLGFPTSNEQPAPGGSFMTFQGGQLTYDARTGQVR